MLVRMSMVLFLFIHWKWSKIEPPWSNPLGRNKNNNNEKDLRVMENKKQRKKEKSFLEDEFSISSWD